MKLKTLMTQASALIAMMMVSLASLAHEGMHASGQAHVGESHMGLMEVSLAVMAMLAVGAWALKEAKSKK
ncbi:MULTISPECIES: hypothetical protein [unclassified Oleiphilus]|jgi:hypothetical protein|uniref:hypothetical protein n=2 Tax=Oleiphilus TaxID=141450 RepID=UPI0007C23C14|nr:MULTISPECIES: hypothetical protein [unclassified Oleiphilus]KZY43432.1 hypothetical protein A3732_14290 [Oleiphilus sp. HI0050]KZY77178.1 hypothetical protein A3740_01475 [Oleiphilus sp. HI0068]KZY79307.1 hypothetical protein A3741_07210 [Oleiphilus sp. HI0069]KZY87329.1 hypothetical protein A3743_14820 [Oleiphilus sp. HI0072]KZZ21044.1 hypothetical protein A3749_18255 [Oleiphilus sp. HI0078]KZZ30134.1 hypothetical protein A3752_02695 [Oleiphilus sp. HI0081]